MPGYCGLRVAGGLPSPGFSGAQDICGGVARLSESELGRRTPVTCEIRVSGWSGVFRSLRVWSACCAEGVGRRGFYDVREFRPMGRRWNHAHFPRVRGG